MLNCPKKDTCINYKIRCFNCGAVADDLHPYPRYVDREEQKHRLRVLLVNKPETLDIVDYLVENGVIVKEM